jgi:hypothetical protein
MSEALTHAQRAALRRAVVEALRAPDDAPIPVERFLPLACHRDVLVGKRLLIVGERGAGKTALFHFLNEVSRRRWPLHTLSPLFAQVPAQAWWSAHDLGADMPLPDLLAPLEGAPGDARLWWAGRLAASVSAIPGLPAAPPTLDRLRALDPNEVGPMVAEARASGAALFAWLGAVDRQLKADDRRLCLSYDFLDRASPAGGLRGAAKLVAPLIALWTDLSARFSHLLGRIFVRPDLLELAKGEHTDASKWSQSAVHLSWTDADLLQALMRQLGADDATRAWLCQSPGGLRFSEHAELGCMPDLDDQLPLLPGEQAASALPEGAQRRLGARLAGEVMGTGQKKGYTHKWLVNHVRDGKGRAVPRSLLGMVRTAAELALNDGDGALPGLQLLAPRHLVAAQGPVGERRLTELRELAPDAVDAMRRALGGCHLPIADAELRAQLSRDPALQRAPEEVIRELEVLGALTQRFVGARSQPELRWDVPELLRTSLNAKRKGGPKRAAPRR